MAIVALGLGSNIDRPLMQLRQAVRRLQSSSDIQLLAYSRIYRSAPLVPEHAPQDWLEKPYLNAAVSLKTDLSPEALLQRLKTIEHEMGRASSEKWAPRRIDLDILAYDDLVLKAATFTLPHAELHHRPFAWIPLQEVLPGYQHPLYRNLSLSSQNLQVLPHLLVGPQIVGILNITPDSFSDGGLYQSPEEAVRQAQKLFNDGADVIDIGAESTRPGAILLSADEEWQRLEPVLAGLKSLWGQAEDRPLISIDTRRANIIEQALPFGVDWINDVSQMEFLAMASLMQAMPHLSYVTMHHCGIPHDPAKIISGSPLDALLSFHRQWQERFDKVGVSRDRLIVDPGIGYGKTPLQQYEVLRQFNELTKAGGRWLVGHSRKSLFSKVEAQKTALGRDVCTGVVSGHLALSGVHYLRVHEPAANLAAIRLTQQLQ